MLKALTAFTKEIDDTEAAVAEILEQLQPEANLLANSVGIIACYAEFIDSEALREVCAALPFPTVGVTTLMSAGPGDTGAMIMSLFVLTSDDVRFAVGLSDPITVADDAPLRAAYDTAKGELGGQPSLMLSFAPLLMNVGADFFVDAMNRISGNLPNFGTVTVDHNADYHAAQVLHNGEAYRDRYAFVLMDGEVEAHFYIASISSNKVFRKKGVVTSVQNNQLQTVNDAPVVEYLLSLGLKANDDGTITGVNSFPFVVDYNDGTTPVVRVIFALTPEGYAVCGGDIPLGATLSVGSIDAPEVVATTSAELKRALAAGKPDALLMYSCAGRYFSLGFETTSEIDEIQGILADQGIPYQFAYSGSELCPVYARNQDDKVTNRNHNDTFIVCTLFGGRKN